MPSCLKHLTPGLTGAESVRFINLVSGQLTAMEHKMETGKIYRTTQGKTVEVVKYHQRLNAWLCLWDDCTACWYDSNGRNQMWDADKEPDKYHIDFTLGLTDAS